MKLRENDQALVPPVYGINAVTGVGKTTAARNVVPDLLRHRPAGTTIYFATPTHVLAEELAMTPTTPA